MTANIILFPQRHRSKNSPLGGCPQCGDPGVYFNVGRDHWATCPDHKVKWFVGSNLFSAWRDETEEVWRRDTDELCAYRTVEPVFPKLPDSTA
jgi:hypothetical protein